MYPIELYDRAINLLLRGDILYDRTTRLDTLCYTILHNVRRSLDILTTFVEQESAKKEVKSDAGLFSFGSNVAYKKQQTIARHADYDFLFKILVIGDAGLRLEGGDH
jgi:hypothetical protein